MVDLIQQDRLIAIHITSMLRKVHGDAASDVITSELGEDFSVAIATLLAVALKGCSDFDVAIQEVRRELLAYFDVLMNQEAKWEKEGEHPFAKYYRKVVHDATVQGTCFYDYMLVVFSELIAQKLDNLAILIQELEKHPGYRIKSIRYQLKKKRIDVCIGV